MEKERIFFRPIAAEQQARRVRYVLEVRACTLRDGGRVTRRDLDVLSQAFHELLDDIGGFEEVVVAYASAGRM